MLRYLLLLILLSAPLPARALEAGAAREEIIPAAGAPLNGYGDRMARSSMGSHDPLWARALYLNDGQTQVLLVNTDLCMINRELRTRVLEIAPSGVPRENIILTATHTHNGPGAMNPHLPMRFVAGRFMPEVLEATAQSIAKAMRTAMDAKKRAAIGFGTEKQQVLSRNRRTPNGPIDEQIGVIRVDDADGNAIALIANFAAHPTSVPEEDHYRFSADFPGFYYNELERISSPGCVAMFLNGAEGDQTIGNPERKEGWAQTESVGRLLAVRVKGIANEIACTDAVLKVASAQATLPPTIAGDWQPKDVFLQTLEIGDLLLTFFPGEPVVDIGLQMRRLAMARGYANQFTVGLSNDYLMYFVPQEKFAEKTYESAMNFFGPRIAEWYYGEFGKLMSKGAVAEPSELPEPEAVSPQELQGALRLRLSGTGRQIGLQRGRAFAEELRKRFEQTAGELTVPDRFPEGSLWRLWPAFLDQRPIAVPVLAMAARPLAQNLPQDLFEELEGMAEGAGLPFDALWLLQHAASFQQRKDPAPLFEVPLCTMFAVTGDRAGAEGVLVGRNLDWPVPEKPVVIDVRPATGHAFTHLGFAWNAGTFTGMNDAGVAVMLERVRAFGEPSMKGPPVEFALRQVLQEAGSFLPALEFLRAQTHLRGYAVLLAGEEAGEPMAAVIDFSNRTSVRNVNQGIVAGVEADSDAADSAAAARYGRLRELLAPEQILGVKEIQQILQDTTGSAEPLFRIWNQQTQHGVVFEPHKQRMYVTFRSAEGSPTAWQTIEAGGRGTR